MHARSFEGKNGFSCIFTSSAILPTPKIFIKIIKGLPALGVLNFQSPGLLKAVQYTESPSIFKFYQEQKFEADATT